MEVVVWRGGYSLVVKLRFVEPISRVRFSLATHVLAEQWLRVEAALAGSTLPVFVKDMVSFYVFSNPCVREPVPSRERRMREDFAERQA